MLHSFLELSDLTFNFFNSLRLIISATMAFGSDFRNFLDENLGIDNKAESKIAAVICELISFLTLTR